MNNYEAHSASKESYSDVTPRDSNCLQKVEVWGSNHLGQLGLGSGKFFDIDRALKLPFTQQILKIAMGQSHTALITS